MKTENMLSKTIFLTTVLFVCLSYQAAAVVYYDKAGGVGGGTS